MMLFNYGSNGEYIILKTAPLIPGMHLCIVVLYMQDIHKICPYTYMGVIFVYYEPIEINILNSLQ